MPEVNQIFFSHKELVEILLKKAGIHEGRWMLTANLGFSAGNFGPSSDQLSPGGVVAILQMGISRAGPEIPEQALSDAAIVNPAPKSDTSVKRKAKASRT